MLRSDTLLDLSSPAQSSARRCIFCSEAVDAWRPYAIRTSDLSSFLRRVGFVGSNLDRFACPHCGSTDRERHLRLYIERLHLLEGLRGGAALHLAPERTLSAYLEHAGFTTYVRGDLHPTHDGVQRVNLERMPFPNRSFDLVVCNHVLEHVSDADAALAEIRRVLKPGGRAICQTPFAPRLSRTFEDPRLQSPEDRLFFYGQQDHVRLFGADIADRIRANGLTGRMIDHELILPDVDPEACGINEDEPFFDVVRPVNS
jgi:SAM-dependent methyltransferase